MKGIKITAFLLMMSGVMYAQKYTPADAGSKVHFVIKNFSIKTGGDFTGLKGSIVFDPNALNTSSFNVSVNSTTIDTDNGTRDKHLRKEEYFNVEKFPLITFVSTKVTNSTTAGRFYVSGNLTIKGVTKAVEFGFSATPATTGYVFKGEFEINRRDFGVGGSSVSLSDNLKVTLAIAANK
jgi:polyisoprenoid-binding protein YceI